MPHNSQNSAELVTTITEWHLDMIMTTHNISIDELADLMECSPAKLSKFRKLNVMPKLNSKEINQLLQNISTLAGRVVRYSELIKFTEITASGVKITHGITYEGSLLPGGSMLTTIDTRRNRTGSS